MGNRRRGTSGIMKIASRTSRIAILVMSISLGACTTTSTNYGRPKVITPQTFACSDGQYARVKVYSPEEAVMGYQGKQYELKRAVSASGAKYVGRGAEFWSKGISAMITVDGKVTTCNTVPADASGEEDLTLPGDAMVPYPAASVEEAAFDGEDGVTSGAASPMPALKPVSITPSGPVMNAPAPTAPTPAAKPKTITTAN